MAKDNNDSSLDDLDSILASLEGDDDFGLDGESKKPKNKREAVEQVLKDTATGFTDHFKSEPVEKIKKFVETAVPRGIQKEVGFVSDTVNEVKKVYQEDAKELKSNSKELLDIVKSKMPDNSGVKKILDKISSKLGIDDDSPIYRGPSQDEIIAETLDNLFKQKDARESTREAVSEIKENHKFEHETKLTNKMIYNLELKNDFDRNYTLNYYRKSIELKMKTMLITKELLETTRVSQQGFKTQFEAIIKNTSLPDLIKLKNSEQTKEAFKQRFRENLTDMFFATATPLEIMKKNIIAKSRETIGTISNSLSMGLMGAGVGSSMNDMPGMMNKSQMVGGELGNWVSNFAGEIANKKLEDNQTVRDKLRKLKLIFADPKDAMFEMSSKESDKNTILSRFKARIYKSIGKLAQTEENDKLRIREHAPDEATFFDYRTKNSIVKIIPMILSKIYSEVRASRTGEDPSGIYYDYTTGKLEESKNIKDRIKNNIKGGLAGVAGANLESIMKMLENEEDGTLDEETKNDFKSAILSHLVKDGTISPTGLEKEKFLKLLPEDKREEFRKRFDKVMEKSKADIRIIDDIKDSLYNIKANTPYIDKLVEEMYKNGNIEEIVKMGILDYDDKEGIYTVNKNKYQEMLDSSLREMKTYDASSFNPNNITTSSTEQNPNEDSMGKIFKDGTKKAYDKVNEKFGIDKKLETIQEEIEKISTAYDVDGKIQDIKDLSVSDLKDPEKRKRLFKKVRARAKLGKRSLSNKVDELKENVKIVAEMTPEEIKEYLLSKQPTLEDWIDNKIKNSKEITSAQIENIRNTDTIKSSEEHINKFIKQHRLKSKYNLLKRNTLHNVEKLSEKFGIEEKIESTKGYIQELDNKHGISSNVLENYNKTKGIVENQLKKISSSDIVNQNRLAPAYTTNNFTNFKFQEERAKRLRDTKLKDILSLEKVDVETLHEYYRTSAESVSGIDFLTWAKNLRLKFVNGQFIRMPEDARFENLRSTVISYLEKQSQGIFNKDKKDKFSGIKSIFGIEAGMTPLQILGKVLKKTRAWDRKIMFDIVPKAMGKVFKFPFKVLKGGAKALYNGVFSRNTMNFARVLAGLDPIYPDGKDGKLSKVKEGLDKTRELDKKIVKGTPKFIIDMIKKVSTGSKKAKAGVGTAWDWLHGREKKEEVKETIKETKSKIFGDEDGDGDRDGSWQDQAQQAKDKKPKDDKIINLNLPKEKDKDSGLFGMLATGFGAITTILGKVYKVLGGIPFIGKGIKFMGSTLVKGFKYLGKPLLGLLSKLGILGLGGAAATTAVGMAEGAVAAGTAGKVTGEVVDKLGNKVDPKTIKPAEGSKILQTLKAFKDKIIAKLGPKASVKVLGTLSAKVASRIVPIAGAALLAYDGIMIAKDMIQNGTSFMSAVSRQILGFDLFNDDEPVLDEDGNPVKPDELSGEEFAKDSLIQEYLEKSKTNPEEANKFRQENGLSMEDIATGVNKKKQQDAYMNSTEYSEAYQKAMNTKNILNKSGKTLAESYGSGLDITTGTFNLAKSKEAVGKMLDDVAKQTGVDANMLKTVAAIESGMNPMASAGTSSAKGLFQFIDGTWKSMLNQYGKKYGLDTSASVLDPMANALMGAEYIKENSNVLRSVKKDINSTDLYMAHFLGASGAKQFLKADPNTIGAALLPSAASANKTIFYKEGGVPRTVGEIYQFLQNLVARRAKEYGFTPGPNATSTVEGATQPVAPLVPESNNNTPTPTQPTNNSFSKDVATSNTPEVNNVPKTPTTNEMTSGFVPTTKTVSSQPEVDFSKGSDILQKSLEVQQSMDSTLKNILTKISELNSAKSASENNTSTPTTEKPKEQTSLDNPEAVIDLTKKRFF